MCWLMICSYCMAVLENLTDTYYCSNCGHILNLAVPKGDVWSFFQDLQRNPEFKKHTAKARMNYYITRLRDNPKPITELTLDQLGLRTLPDSLAKLKNLEKLSLADNQLKVIPESLGNLSNLKDLDLSDNKIKNLPESIGKISNLNNIYLRDNKIKNIP